MTPAPYTSIEIIPILNDNYAYVLTASNGKTAIIDPGESEPVIQFCKNKNISPDYIFLTHHHGDHINGAKQLKQIYDCEIFGPGMEKDKIGILDHLLDENSTIEFGDEMAQIIETPGHTKGHIVYYFPHSKILLSGDTLFVMGCGRIFEGTMEDMYQSLTKLSALPDDTRIYCGHEYTLANAKFAADYYPKDKEIEKRLNVISNLRAKQKITIPSTIKEEKETNPFLRATSSIKFAEIRRAKDQF